MGTMTRPGYAGGTGGIDDFDFEHSKNLHGPTSEQLIKSMGDMLSTATKRSDRLFDSSIGGLDDVMGYLRKIVGGDREEMFRAVAPEIGAVTDQYDTAYKTVLERAPRGGGRTSAAINLKTTEAGQVGSMIAGARTQGVQQLQSFIAQLLGASAQQSTIAGQAAAGGLQGRLGKDAQSADAWDALGQSIGLMLGIAATGGKGLFGLGGKAPAGPN